MVKATAAKRAAQPWNAAAADMAAWARREADGVRQDEDKARRRGDEDGAAATAEIREALEVLAAEFEATADAERRAANPMRRLGRMLARR